MQELMIINLNNKNWCEIGPEEIIEQAVENYLGKRRSTRIYEPEQKRLRLGDEKKLWEAEEDGSSSSDDDYESSECENE